MKLYQNILSKILSEQPAQITFSNLSLNTAEIVELECYRMLCQIKSILDNDSIDDPECFQKIEEIICLFEKIACPCGNRHDFG